MTFIEDTAIDHTNSRPDRNPSRTLRDEIPPRPKKPGRRRSRPILGLWARVSLLLLGIVALVFAGIGLIAKAARPYHEVGTQGGQLTVARRDIADLDSQNAVLRRRIAYLKTGDGIASEARKVGYLRPGEVPLVVLGGAPALPTPAASHATTAPAQSHGSSAAQRFWRHLTGH